MSKFTAKRTFKKGDIVTLDNGTEYFVNGLNAELQQLFASRSGLEYQEWELAKRKVKIVNAKYFDEDTDVAAQSRSWFDDKKQPSAKVVKHAMIWEYDGYGDYRIKAGGGSASDSVFVSHFKTTIACPKTGNDKDVVILKKYGLQLEDVLITIDEIQELQDKTETQAVRTVRRKDNLYGIINIIIRHLAGFPTTSNNKMAPEDWIKELFQELKSEYSNAEIEAVLEKRIANDTQDLNTKYLNETPQTIQNRQSRYEKKMAVIELFRSKL